MVVDPKNKVVYSPGDNDVSLLVLADYLDA